MWIVAKYEKNKKNFFLDNLKKELNNDIEIYDPIRKFENFSKKKIIEKHVNILGDYIFCFSDKFIENSTLGRLNFIKGLKYILNGSKDSQEEIKDFIKNCKNLEDKNGFIIPNFFNLEITKKYKFKSGPFLNLIFQVIEVEKQKIKIIIGDKVLRIKKGFSFSHI